ncbi:MAG: primosomal protein N' [Gammaproteobacteria bacterium]|nr:primosomal protein N' [Gammaproteobacteria bacterium]
MRVNQYLRIALPTPLRRLFDYLPPQDIDFSTLMPGMRIRVPFQSRELVGILINIVNETPVLPHKLKLAHSVLDAEPILMPDIFKLCAWAADYYQAALGEVLHAAIPVHLRKGKDLSKVKSLPAHQSVAIDRPPLNVMQQVAIDKILAAKHTFQTFLLDGITGSGKTEVYLQVIEVLLKEDRQVLVLLPEISLTPQTLARFSERFPVKIAALHSNLTERERMVGWLATKTGEAKIVIGTRSAIFTPFKNLGLIIVDEEHDQSFKQQDHMRYQARDLAVVRANFSNIPIILGSATPSLETLFNAERKRYTHLILNERAGDAILPTFEMIDLSQTKNSDCLSKPLLAAMRAHLQAGNQVMLFLNRRGYAPLLYCTACRSVMECKRCAVRLVYHLQPGKLICHQCDKAYPAPKMCQACGADGLKPVGVGTERLEELVQQYFPTIPLLRFDRDSTQKKGSLQILLDQIHQGEPVILLGTQMLAKGHHFSQVTLVGIIDGDSGFFSSDFRATEQIGQLITQVAGRAGRGKDAGTVMIQTHQPDDPLLKTLIHEGYAVFAKKLLAQRQHSHLPPYTHIALLRAESYHHAKTIAFLKDIKKHPAPTGVEILGPMSPLLPKRKGLFCEQLLIKTSQRKLLHHYLALCGDYISQSDLTATIRWSIDVDPVTI